MKTDESVPAIISIVHSLLRSNKEKVKTLYVAKYRYVPGAISNNKRLEILHIPSVRFNQKTLSTVSRNMRLGWELGLISHVHTLAGKSYHIPQIDFICNKSSHNTKQIKKCLKSIADVKPKWLVDSGNSYHCYGEKLLTEKQWKDFLGRCLLCNTSGEKPLVDTRWIGHSIIQNFTNLRILGSLTHKKPRIVSELN